MTTLTATERGELATRMLPVAARLACIARGDGDARDIAHALDPLDRIELVAVIVDLASMIDPDAYLSDLLGHVNWDEHGQPAKPDDTGKLRLRSLVPYNRCTPSGNDALLDHEQAIVARELTLQHGMGPKEISARIGVHERTIARWKQDDWQVSA